MASRRRTDRLKFVPEKPRRRRRILQLDWRENLGLPNRSLEAKLEARQKLAEVFRRVRPKWLFAPYWVDAHPDHVAATQLWKRQGSGRSSRKSRWLASRFIRREFFTTGACICARGGAPTFVVDISEFWDAKRKR